MTERIEPFYRLPATSDRPRWVVWTWRLMRVHFAAAGILLFFAAAGLFGYLYSLEFQRIGLDIGKLRITRPGDIYDTATQIKLIGGIVLAVASLIQVRAVQMLSRTRRSGLAWARVASLMLLVGFPAGAILWVKAGSDAAEGGMVAQVLSDLSLAVRLLAAVLVVQAALGVWYEVASLLPSFRVLCGDASRESHPVLVRIRRMAVALWLLAAVGLGGGLAIATDWLYELPVSRPAPGALLYATSFDDFNNEWDIFPGRDAVQIIPSADLGLPTSDVISPDGAVLSVKYGSGVSDEVIWSALNRKFNDFDLRVTARLANGPVDQNQFGVIFRYRNPDNFYIFRISADGYYSLAKVKNGVQEKISDWGQTAAIRQGVESNAIRIIARQDTFQFYVNNQIVPLCLKGENETSMWATWEGPGVCFTSTPTDVYHDATFKQGQIALAAGTIDGSEIEVLFDDLVIVGPQPDTSQAAKE